VSERILFVDDDPRVLSALKRNLRRFELVTAVGPHEGLASLRSEGPFALVVTDMNMPDMSGVDFLKQVRRQSPDTVRVMLTGNSDQRTAMQAVNRGSIFRFLTKPCQPEDLLEALEAGLEQHRLVRAERELLEETLSGAVKVLTEILSISSSESFGRATRVRDMALAIAAEAECAAEWELEVAAMLAELGRVALPAELERKLDAQEELDEDERAILAAVPQTGSSLLANIPRLEGVAAIVREQGLTIAPLERSQSGQILALANSLVAREDAGAQGTEFFLGEGLRVLAAYEPALSTLPGAEDAPQPKALSAEAGTRQGTEFAPEVHALAQAELVAAAQRVVAQQLGSHSGVPQQEVDLEQLRVGDVLATPLFTADQRRLLREGHRITSIQLARIRNYDRVAGVLQPIAIVNRLWQAKEAARKARQ